MSEQWRAKYGSQDGQDQGARDRAEAAQELLGRVTGTTDNPQGDLEGSEGVSAGDPELAELEPHGGGGTLLRCLICDGEDGRPWWSHILKRDTLGEADEAWTAHYRQAHGGQSAGVEVLEPDDTVPVERLAGWLHGEFGGPRSWHQTSEGAREGYRQVARNLRADLPELFR